nr:hypothetical protein 18 [bacterium]
MTRGQHGHLAGYNCVLFSVTGNDTAEGAEMEIIDYDMLRSAQKGKGRAGKKDLIKHLKGERITRPQAVKAKCYDCMGMGEQTVCSLKGCALYPYSPYASTPEKGVVEQHDLFILTQPTIGLS